MTDSFVKKNQGTQHTASGASARKCVGCLSLLPLLPLLLLVDLIGKAIIWGIASLFGVEIPGLAITVKWMAYAILIPLGAILIAALIWILHVHISECISSFFRKDSKGNPTETHS